MRRRGLRAASLLAALTLVTGACGGGSPAPPTDASGNPVPPGTIVSEALNRATAARSGSFSIKKTIHPVGVSLIVVADGVFTADPSRSAMSIYLRGDMPEAMVEFDPNVEEVDDLDNLLFAELRIDERFAYLRVLPASDGGTNGWVRLRIDEVSATLQDELGAGTPISSLARPHVPLLALIAEVDPELVRTAGSRTFDGEAMAGYVVPVPAIALAQETVSPSVWRDLIAAGVETEDLGDPVDVELWVSANGQVRFVQADLAALSRRIASFDAAPEVVREAGGPPIVVTMSLIGLDQPVDVDPPPQEALFDTIEG